MVELGHQPQEHKRDWVAIFVSALALIATSINAYSAYSSFELNRETQRAQLNISREAQRTAIFAQFQQQYTFVFARFPAKFLNPNFRPKRGTDAYARLEAYWLFCFSEWYATNRLAPDAYADLWDTYYTPLIMNGVSIPSLHYVLEDMISDYPLERGDYRNFFKALANLARKAGNPLAQTVETRLKGN